MSTPPSLFGINQAEEPLFKQAFLDEVILRVFLPFLHLISDGNCQQPSHHCFNPRRTFKLGQKMEVTSQPTAANPEPPVASQEDHLNLAGISEALRLCTRGNDPVSVMAGEKILQSCQNHKQYLPALGAIVSEDGQPDDVRTMAAILFRNNTEKFWRSGPLQLEEPVKREIRGSMFVACFRPRSSAVSGKRTAKKCSINRSINQSSDGGLAVQSINQSIDVSSAALQAP